MEKDLKSMLVYVPKSTWSFFRMLSIKKETSMVKILREILENYETEHKGEENL